MRGSSGRFATRFAALLLALASLVGAAVLMTGVASAGPPVSSVATELKANPVYVDPALDSFTVDAARIKAAIPANTYLAVLAPAALPAGLEADELPALLSSQLGRGGTVIVLLGGRFYGASTTAPGGLADELATAQAALPATGGDATGTLVSLVQSLSGTGNLADPTGPARAGGPIGGPILIIGLVLVVVAGVVLFWWLRRKPSSRRTKRAKRPQRPRDLVEIDAAGNVVRRIPASEREF
jgi:hypothetical protein